jgi:hypothetical protein
MDKTMQMAREAGFWQEHINTYMCSTDAIKAFEVLVRADEREKAKHNEEVLMNALWKACGDDGQMVVETIESQGELK